MFNGGMTMGPSLADIAAITNRQNDDGNGFNNGWWILILLMADKDEIIAQLRTQLNQCTLAASQQAQNQYLISQLRPSANPAYIVDNPFRSTGNLPCQQPTCCNG